MKPCSRQAIATGDVAYGNEGSSQTQRSTERLIGSYDAAVAVYDPRTSEILRQLQAKMAEMEKIVGEVGGLVTQLAGDEDEATARAVERTRRAFQFLRSAPRQAARKLKER